MEVAVENIATRAALAEGRPTTVSSSARLGRSGDMTLFLSADPWAKGLTFAGRFQLQGFKTAELYDLIEAAANLHAPEGTIDVFAEFTAKDGKITGGVKPVLKNVKVRADDDGFLNRLKAWAVDKTLDLFSDRVPGRNAVATVIPIKGTVDSPKAQLWPTILGVIRNAFVQGITEGFAHVPPDTAGKKEGVLKQVKDALDDDKGPPQAQPEKASNKKK
jgi:hypothetical protein